MAENIDDLVSAKAFADMERLNKLLNDTVEKILVINKNGILQEAAVSSSKGIKETSDAVKKLADNNEQLATTITEVKEAQVQATAATNTYTTAINNQQKAELKAQQEASAWAAKQQVNTTKQTAQVQQQIVSINSLTEANKRLRKERDALDISGNNNKIKLEAINKKINENTALIIANTDAAKKQAANVGNYPKLMTQAAVSTEKFTFSLTKAWSGLRNLAYIIPGLGIAGIFDLAFQAISPLVSKVYELATGTKEAAKASMVLASAFEATEYKKAVTDVNELRINIDLAKKGFLDKTDVVNQYNKTLGESLGKVTSLDEAEKMLVKNGDAYIQMTLLKAAANIALDKAAEQYVKAELVRQTEMKKVKGASASYDGGQGGSRGMFQDIIDLNNNRGLGVDAVKNEVAGIKKEGDEYIDVAKQFQQNSATIAKSLGIDFFGKEYDVKAKKVKEARAKAIIDVKDTDDPQALRKYYEKVQKEQMQILGEMINDPESKKVFDEFLLGEVLAGDQSVSEDKAASLAKDLYAAIQAKAEKLSIEVKLKLKRDNMLKELQEIVQAVANTTEILGTISDIQHDREMMKINERDKALENSYDNEKKAIEASGLSKEAKEKQLMELEAKREQQRKQTERERIASERKRAQQQKAFDIANIITSTALAVVKQLAATPLPAGAPFVALVAAAGVAQLARAIAAPLPQYKHGTLDHKGGLAIVGDGGVSELVVEPGGKAYMTAAKATIMDLPAHTQVFNQEQMMQGVNNLAFQKLGNGQKVTTDSMTIAMLQSFDEMTRDMKGIKKAIGSLELGLTLEGDFARFLNKKNIIS